MPEEKKSTYRGSSDAMRKAIRKYQSERVEDIKIRVPKGRKDEIKAFAAGRGESLNQFIVRLIDEEMARE